MLHCEHSKHHCLRPEHWVWYGYDDIVTLANIRLQQQWIKKKTKKKKKKKNKNKKKKKKKNVFMSVSMSMSMLYY